MATNETKSFRAFLRTYLEEDSPFGDLARDSFSILSNWTGTTASSLRRHMRTFNCCDEALEALTALEKLFTRGDRLTNICFMGPEERDPEIINYVINAFRSCDIEIEAEDGGFKVYPNCVKQQRLVSLLCSDLDLVFC
ncbi:hypothetical protein D0A34_09665 [Microcoleus vaginatus PCC 9802]|uniref:hypothetical protein n=1 Tax=Microcoleus vaginatus TaxID=119532 RepID=UPI00020D1D8F|nr:hypothetical protein MicvaDRAFT_0039 [Microcoleus vaginatus FGP-2]UNU19102.1 hypothetical protein D0A34_09665 [Microcoleus vaginatus PCC 9802]